MTKVDDALDAGKLGLGPQAVVGALTAFAGRRLAGDLGVVAAGAALPYALAMAEKVRDEWRRDQRYNVGAMAAAAAIEAGWNPEELGDRMARTATTRMLTGLAAEAAAKTAWPPKVIALGRVLADGLTAADDKIDLPQYALAAMADMERLHVVLLDLLVKYEPDRAGASMNYTVAARRTAPEHLVFGGLSVSAGWSVGQRSWSGPEIMAVQPQLAPVLDGVAGTLQRHGLAERGDRTRKQLAKVLRDALEEADSASRHVPRHQVPHTPTHGDDHIWSPTELGERVLGFYLDAARSQ